MTTETTRSHSILSRDSDLRRFLLPGLAALIVLAAAIFVPAIVLEHTSSIAGRTLPTLDTQTGWSSGYALAKVDASGVVVGPGRDNPNVFAQSFATEPGAQYNVRASATSVDKDKDEADALIQINWHRGDGSFIGVSQKTFPIGKHPTKITQYVIAPHSARLGYLYVAPGSYSLVRYTEMSLVRLDPVRNFSEYRLLGVTCLEIALWLAGLPLIFIILLGIRRTLPMDSAVRPRLLPAAAIAVSVALLIYLLIRYTYQSAADGLGAIVSFADDFFRRGDVQAILLLAAATVALYINGALTVTAGLRRFAAFLLGRCLFRVPIARDAVRVNLLRIVTGALYFHRSLHSAEFVFSAPWNSEYFAVVMALVLAFCFTIGLLTPLVALALLFFHILVVDAALNTYTLGSGVLSMILLVFAFLPAGTHVSFDSLIIRRGWPGSAVVQTIYRVVGSPTLMRAVITKFACLLSYSLLCIYSLLTHIDENFWLSGDVGVLLLMSSYLSRYYYFFQEALTYTIPFYLARLSMQIMIVWYAVFLAFILLGGIFRKLVLIWAFLFFLVSTFILQLGWLGLFEFVFLALLFWNRRFLNIAKTRSLDVLYDDRCNLCDRTVRFLSFCDLFAVLRFRPLSENAELVARLGLSHGAALQDLYGHDPRTGETFSGYAFYMEIAKRLLLLVWLYPLLWIGRIIALGPAAYRIVARHRIEWFGVCTRSAHLTARNTVQPLVASSSASGRLPQALFAAFAVIQFALSAHYVATMPHSPLHRLPADNLLYALSHPYGLMPINVFNRGDISLSENWFTLHAVDKDGNQTLVSFVGQDGERLEWHRSDRVYFANSLNWRRNKLGKGPTCYESFEEIYLKELAVWYGNRDDKDVDHFIATYFHQPLPDIRHEAPHIVTKPIQTVCTVYLDRFGTLKNSS